MQVSISILIRTFGSTILKYIFENNSSNYEINILVIGYII